MQSVASTRRQATLLDLGQGLFGSPVWLHLAWQEVKQRYRRSLLGPFWMTISTGVMVGAMGPLYSRLMGQPVGSYFQYLSVSLVTWLFVSGFLNDCCGAFISSESFIKQVRLPLSTYVVKVLARNTIIFAHNFLVMAVVLVVFPPAEPLDMLLAPIGFVLVLVNLLWVGFVLAVISARFRDIPQIVASVVQVLFFITPIVWKPEQRGLSHLVAEANPFNHLLDVMRAPLLGTLPAARSWVLVSAMAVVGSAVAFVVFNRYRARIAYWV